MIARIGGVLCIWDCLVYGGLYENSRTGRPDDGSGLVCDPVSHSRCGQNGLGGCGVQESFALYGNLEEKGLAIPDEKS